MHDNLRTTTKYRNMIFDKYDENFYSSFIFIKVGFYKNNQRHKKKDLFFFLSKTFISI